MLGGPRERSGFPPPSGGFTPPLCGLVLLRRSQGFEFEDRRYQSLSAIAKDVTGSKWNGFLFFGIAGGGALANGHTPQGVSE